MRFRATLLAAFLLLWASPAFSQGCAMCYSSAKATSTDGQRAISRGVVVLLFPPVGFMTFGVWMALRYAKKRDLEQNQLAELEEIWKDQEQKSYSLPCTQIQASNTHADQMILTK